VELLRPRDESFHAVAASESGGQVAAIRSADSVLVLIGPTGTTADTTRPWSAVGPGSEDTIIVGAQDGMVAAFRAGKLLWTIQVSTGAIRHVRGAYVVDETGAVWKINDGQAQPLATLNEPVTVLSTQGSAVALGTQGGAVWHGSDSGPLVQTTVLHAAPVQGIDWHPDGVRFVTWAVDRKIRQPLTDSRAIIHRVGSTAPDHVTVEVDHGLTAAAWSPDGKTLATAFSTAWLHELDPKDWSLRRSMYHGVEIATGLHFTPDGKRLVLLSRTMMQVREAEWLGQERVQQLDSRRVHDVSRIGEGLLICGADGGLGRWSTARDAHRETLVIGPDRVTSLDLAAKGGFVAAAHRWGATNFWNLNSPGLNKIGSFWVEGEATQVRVTPDGTRGVVAAASGRIESIRRTGDAFVSERFWLTTAPIAAVAIRDDGTGIVAAPRQGGLLRADPESAPTPTNVGSEAERWTALVYTPDGTTIIAGGADGAVCLLASNDLSERSTLTGHTASITRLRTSDDGRWIVSASADETARLWDLMDPGKVVVYRGTHAGAVTSALLTPDARRVITACDDSILRVFDRASGVELIALKEHDYGILDLEISADGRRLLTRTAASRPASRSRGTAVMRSSSMIRAVGATPSSRINPTSRAPSTRCAWRPWPGRRRSGYGTSRRFRSAPESTRC
jgi:WD40 repeat protein